MENLSPIVKKPRLLLSNDDPNQVVSYDMIFYHFKAKRVNHSPYDIRISDLRNFGFDENKCYQKLALFLQQNIYIYSFSFRFIRNSRYFDQYILPVLSQHPGLRSIELRNYSPSSPIPLCSFLFYNTRLTQVSLIDSIRFSKDLNTILQTYFNTYTTSFSKLSICRSFYDLVDIENFPNSFYPTELHLLRIEFKTANGFSSLLYNEDLENLSVGYLSSSILADRIALIIQIASHPNLRTLKLVHTPVFSPASSIFITSLKNNTCRLESIHLNSVDIPLFDLLHSLSTNTRLTHLEYSDSNCIPYNYSLSSPFTNNQTLQTLKISRCHFDLLGEEELGKILPHLQSLTRLSLAHVALHSVSSEKIALMTSLRSLSLKHAFDDSSDLTVVFSHLTQLEKIKIYPGFDCLETVQAMATNLICNTSLRSLKLGCTKMITDFTSIITQSLIFNHHLVNLDLGNSNIDAAGLISVFSSNVKRFFIERLSHIDLATHYPQIFQALEGNSTLKKISCLQLISMPYTDTILEALLQLIRNNKTIQTLNLFEISNPRYYLRINQTLLAHNTTITEFHTTSDHTFSFVMYRNQMIYESRKHHQRTTLYELLLPILRI